MEDRDRQETNRQTKEEDSANEANVEDRQADRRVRMGRETCREACRETGRQTGKPADRQIEGGWDRWTKNRRDGRGEGFCDEGREERGEREGER